MQSDKAHSPAEQAKSGMLNLKGKNADDWKLRWFVLRGTSLSIYAARGKSEAQRVVNLSGAELKAHKEPRRPFCIVANLKNGIKMELSAESEFDRDDWLEKLQEAASPGSSKNKSAGARVEPKKVSSAPMPRRVEGVPTAQASANIAKLNADPATGGSGGSRKMMFSSASEQKAHAVTSKPSVDNSQLSVQELYEKYKNKLLGAGFEQEEFSRNSQMIVQCLEFEEKREANSRKYQKAHVETDDEEDTSSELSSSSSSLSNTPAPRVDIESIEFKTPIKQARAASVDMAALDLSSTKLTPARTSASQPSIDVVDHPSFVSPRGHRSQNFIERRDSMKFEKKHQTLKDMCLTADPATKYSKMVKIGEGSFGMVFAAVNKESKQRVAIKKMAVTKKNKVHIETELEIHKACSNHPNVVPILESYIVQDAKKHEVWVVLEFLENGSLTETLTQLTMKEPEIAYVCREVLSALSWLHSRNRVHRDIKSDNILLGTGGEVKLADFGLAIQLVKGAEKRRSVLGTPYWMSPEIINGKDYDDRVDIWALGITTIEMMEKHPPYISYPKAKALFLITSQGVPLSHFAPMQEWSEEMKDWLAKCLTYDCVKRPNVWAMVDHPFLSHACTKDVFVKKCIVPMKGKISCSLM